MTTAPWQSGLPANATLTIPRVRMCSSMLWSPNRGSLSPCSATRRFWRAGPVSGRVREAVRRCLVLGRGETVTTSPTVGSRSALASHPASHGSWSIWFWTSATRSLATSVWKQAPKASLCRSLHAKSPVRAFNPKLATFAAKYDGLVVGHNRSGPEIEPLEPSKAFHRQQNQTLGKKWSMHDQPVIALDLAGIGLVIMDAVAVES